MKLNFYAQEEYAVARLAINLKTTLLVSMGDFMIISFQKKNLILLVHNCYNVIMSNEVKQM